MCWVGEPLSSTLINSLTGKKHGVQALSYHMRVLAEAGVIRKVAERPVRGATEKLYRLQPTHNYGDAKVL